MRTGSLREVCRCLAGGRVLALAVVAGLVTAIVGVSPGMATASAAVAAHHPLRPAARGAGGSGLSLAQAPAGLRAAVRKTPGLRAAGSGSTWSQHAELTDPGATAGDFSGGSVAISGSTAVVGTEGSNSFTGAAYVFTRSGTKWSQQAELTAADGAANDAFGVSVAIYESTVVVGAYGNNSNTGAAYVFTRSGTKWSQQAELTAADGAANDAFGVSVAISGSTAAVGAPGFNGAGTGAAYVYIRSGTTWSQQAELANPSATAGDYFGDSVATTGSTTVVGADGTNSGTGAAYVYTRSATTWSQQATLADPGATAGDNFGSAVAIAGSTAVVGAEGSNSGTGAAYVFTRSGIKWSQQAELTAADGTSGDIFGVSVALSGSTAAVGAYGSNSDTGTAYTFNRSGTKWSQQGELTAADGAANNLFGFSVAISGSTALAGAPQSNSNTGAAYVFVRSGTSFPTTGGILFGGTDGLASQQTALGRSLAIVRVYYHIGGTFPASVDAAHMKAGSTMLVSLDSNGQSYASIAAGQSDATISAFLKEVNQAAITYNLSSIFISFQHEPDTSKHASLGTAAQFVQAWDHVHQLAAAANLNWNQNAGGRLLWALILTHHTYAVGTNAGGYWPGPGEADIVAADGYNSFGCGTDPLNTPAELFGPLLSFAKANGGLPSFIAEWASIAANPTAQVQFITQMQAYLTSNSTTIKAADYWDEGGANCDYHVDGNPGSLAALKTLGASPVMQGTAHSG